MCHEIQLSNLLFQTNTTINHDQLEDHQHFLSVQLVNFVQLTFYLWNCQKLFSIFQQWSYHQFVSSCCFINLNNRQCWVLLSVLLSVSVRWCCETWDTQLSCVSGVRQSKWKEAWTCCAWWWSSWPWSPWSWPPRWGSCVMCARVTLSSAWFTAPLRGSSREISLTGQLSSSVFLTTLIRWI